MKLSDFYFDLPRDRIARFPSQRREDSRLMLVERETGRVAHHRFRDLPNLLAGDEFLVVNNTRVLPARLLGEISGHPVEMLFVRTLEEKRFEVLSRPARRFRPGIRIEFGRGIGATVAEVLERGRRILAADVAVDKLLELGYAPLPPYIKRQPDDARKRRDYDLERYQTVYARMPGSIAAPTAGLHFSGELLKGISHSHEILELTLDVGEATFQSIEVEEIEKHRMGREKVCIPAETQKKINRNRQRGKRLVAVGTTSVRALETWALHSPENECFVSELFIRPGFAFRKVDRLITNFHLPGSTLFILVAAFAGLDLMQKSYKTAVEEGYRFFSYGDAMLIR